MADLVALLKKHFRLRGTRHDNLPHLLTPPRRDEGRLALARVLADLGVKTGAEVGVRVGRSAIVWLDSVPGLHLTCIDPWMGDRHDRNYTAAIANLAGRNVTIMRELSEDALPKLADDSLDFLHIDGAHDFDHAALDIIFGSRKVKSGGIIAVHDYLEFHKAGVLDAVRAYTHCHHIDPWFVTRDRLPTAFWQKP